MGATFAKFRKVNPTQAYKPTESCDALDYLDWIKHPPLDAKQGRWKKVKDYVHMYRSLDAKQFEMKAIVGRGSIGTVWLVRFVKDGSFYALKSIRRSSIIHRKNAHRIKQELQILKTMRGSPFIAHVFGTFQNDKNVYFLLEYAVGGELYSLILRNDNISEGSVKFYTAEPVCALHHLHEHSIVFRDLKPDNVVLDENGHIRLVDFGLASYVDQHGFVDKSKSSGTAEYLAPEITRGMEEKHGIGVDWWALGVVMFEMLTGKPPFGARPQRKKYEIFMKINAGSYTWPRRPAVSAAVKKVVSGLLSLNPTSRFGYDRTMSSPWFEGLDWNMIESRRVRPPIIPKEKLSNKAVGDHSHFKAWKEPRYKVSEKLTSAEKAYSDICGTDEVGSLK